MHGVKTTFIMHEWSISGQYVVVFDPPNKWEWLSSRESEPEKGLGFMVARHFALLCSYPRNLD